MAKQEVISDFTPLEHLELFSEKQFCGNITDVQLLDGRRELKLKYGTGTLRLTLYKNGTVRLCCTAPWGAAAVSGSYAAAAEFERSTLTVEDTRHTVRVFSPSGVRAEFSRTDASAVITDAHGDVLLEAPQGFYWSEPEGSIGITGALSRDTRCYGLGEKSGELNKRGRTWHMWNSDEPQHTFGKDPLYASINLCIFAQNGFFTGLFLDEPGSCWFDLGDRREDAFEAAAESGMLDLYLWNSRSPKELTVQYASLTGRMPLPPLWSLGLHQSRYSYFSRDEVESVAREFRKRTIPCDVIYLDIDYMDGYRVFTWNTDAFPAFEEMISSLKEEGFRVVTIIDPGVKADPAYPIYREGKERSFFCTDAEGKVYHGKVWPGVSAFPDFTRREVRRWWADQHRVLFDAGVAGIWNDMNEPADFSGDPYERTKFTPPPEVQTCPEGRPVPLQRLHNVYGLCMCMASREAAEKLQPGKRPFVLTRAAYGGIQRYAAKWTGDNASWWDHMVMSVPMLLNLSLSGVPFVGADAGGFQENATGELFARWVQYAAYTPFFRCHTALGTRRHEPWSFGKEVEAACRKAVQNRYALLPYLYRLFLKASQTGIPVMRPLFFEFPEDEQSFRVNDQFMLGSSLLIAPVMHPGARARAVYLPPGEWMNRESGKRFQGPGYVLAEADLDTIPVFVRCPSLLALTEVREHTGSAFWNPLQLHSYPASSGETGECRVYEDDGESISFTAGVYRLTEWRVEEGALAERVLHDGLDRKPGEVILITH